MHFIPKYCLLPLLFCPYNIFYSDQESCYNFAPLKRCTIMNRILFSVIMIALTLIAVSIIAYCVRKIKKEFKLKQKNRI